MHRIVILGGGTGGTLAANRLRKAYRADEARITVVDRDDAHVYQPGLLFVPFGLTHPEDITRPRGRQLHAGIDYLTTGVDRVETERRTVVLEDGSRLDYDVLVVATGAVLAPEETEGLTGPGWMERVFTFYTPEGAAGLEQALARFDHGRLVVNVVDLPIKCPVAPLEFCFLADWFLRERGVRDEVDLTYVTPLDGAFTKPVASARLGGMLAERDIELVTEFNTGEVDGAGGRLVSYDDREVPFDLAVVVPAHNGAPCIVRSEGLGDELGFVSDRRAHPAVRRPPRRVRTGGRGGPADLQGRLRHPFRGRGARRERAPVPGRGATRRQLRRPRQLLHRDRVPQGDADRLQLRGGAAAGPLPGGRRAAAPEGVPPQPPREAAVPVGLLAQPAARPRPARNPQHHAHTGQAADRPRSRKERTP